MSSHDSSDAYRGGSRFIKLERKLGLSFAVMAILISALLTVGLYHISVDWLRDGLDRRLRDAVTLGATQLDGDAFNRLTTADQESSDEFVQLQNDLRSIRDACSDLRFVYTLRRSGNGEIQFIVDAEEDPDQVSHLADHYDDAGPTISKNIDTIQATLIESEFYTDKWGTWLTGYAPITTTDTNRKVVLCMDIAASTILEREREFLWAALAAFAVTLPLSLIAGTILGRKLAHPIIALTRGAERITGGELDHIVEAGNTDEIGELAVAFNTMTRKLSRSLDSLRKNEEELIQHRDHLEQLVQERTKRLTDANNKMNKDLESAAQVQQGFLPQQPPDLPGVEFAWNFTPCDELGGDMLNIQEIDSRHVGIWIADVCGHGVAAALVSVTLSRLLSTINEAPPVTHSGGQAPKDTGSVPPPDIAQFLNEQFTWDPETMRYFTFLYGILDVDSRVFRYVSAGHPGPLRIRPGDGTAEFLPMAPPAIGIFPEPKFVEHQVTLNIGDRVYLYTDGITETSNPEGEDFSEGRLASHLVARSATPLHRTLEGLLTTLTKWRHDDHPDDDLSMVAFELTEQ